MRQFSHHRKSAACSSRVSFAYNERRHDSDPQFPRSPLGTPGSMASKLVPTKKKKKESLALLKHARLMSEDADIIVGILKSDMDL